MIKLLQGDCLELMQSIPDGSVDMILCDLPYGITKCKWDSVIPFDALWEQYNRVIKDNGAIVLFAQGVFTHKLAMSNIAHYKYEWIWRKSFATGFLNSKRMPLRAHENILVFYKKPPTYNPQFTQGKPYKTKNGALSPVYDENFASVETVSDGRRYPIDVLDFKIEKGLHPTQKPVALLEYLIKTYTNEGETVLDNCMGSGSTGIACKRLNRNFIGIELDKTYFDIAQNRINKLRELVNIVYKNIKNH